MNRISAIILTKNAEDLIADCIDSVSFCDEVIVIDDNSTDRTPDLSRHMGAQVYTDPASSFAEKRNFGLKKAKGKWVFYIDSDERVTPELKKSIEKIIGKERSGVSAYKIKRKNYYFGKHEWPYIEKLERLFKKSKLQEWYGALHETPKVDGLVEDIEDGFLVHYTHRDLTSMVEKTNNWSEVEAELRLKSHHPKMSAWRFFRVMLTAFYNSYVKQEGWRAGTAGLVESIFQAFSMFITYAKLWEKQNKI